MKEQPPQQNLKQLMPPDASLKNKPDEILSGKQPQIKVFSRQSVCFQQSR